MTFSKSIVLFKHLNPENTSRSDSTPVMLIKYIDVIKKSRSDTKQVSNSERISQDSSNKNVSYLSQIKHYIGHSSFKTNSKNQSRMLKFSDH